MRHVVFTAASERYALPLAAVREVVVPATLSRVPRSPAAVCGIMNLRGRVVTVVDLGVLFGLCDPPDLVGVPP
ncbi:MAG: chemotaxis protein CheW, partial [Myxococcales bacterium]